MKLKSKNVYRKVTIENIVFFRGDDFLQYEQEKEQAYSLNMLWSDINYLLQWYYPNEHETRKYYAMDINTPFLGKLIKIKGYTGYFLFSKNSRIGYIGLSRIVSFEKV